MTRKWTAWMRGLAAGALVGLSVGGVLALAGGILYVQREAAALEQQWQAVEVVTVVEEVPAGAALTRALLGTGMLPRRAVTASVVRPEALAQVLGRRVMVRLQPGDTLLWTQVCAEGQEGPGCSEEMGVRPAVGTVGGGQRQAAPASGWSGPSTP